MSDESQYGYEVTRFGILNVTDIIIDNVSIIDQSAVSATDKQIILNVNGALTGTSRLEYDRSNTTMKVRKLHAPAATITWAVTHTGKGGHDIKGKTVVSGDL